MIIADSFEYLSHTDDRWDHIISDPPYDLDKGQRIDLFHKFYRVSRGNIVLFCNPENQWPGPDEWLFWAKPLSTKNFSKRCGRFVEMIAVYRSEGGPFNQLHWSQMVGLYDDRLEDRVLAHPYQKPLSLIERLVKIYTNYGDRVLDPFAGSGTVEEACERWGRRCTSIEKNPL